MQWKHVAVVAGEDFVAAVHDQPVNIVGEPAAGMVHIGCGFLQLGIGTDHLDRHQILADAEMLQGALGLGTPQPIGGNVDLSEAVGFLPHVRHGSPMGWLAQL